MRKFLLLTLAALLLVLAACNADQSAPSASMSTEDSDSAAITATDTAADTGSLPDFVLDFRFDQLELDNTPTANGDDYLDYLVYLLTSDQTAQLSELLDPTSWTPVGELSDIVCETYARYFDCDGNQLVISTWDNESCILTCISAEGDTVQYSAPLSVLEAAQSFNEDLTPLGAVSYTAQEYYDLFCADPGFITLGDTPFSDDDLSAYAITRLASEDSYDWETGCAPEKLDAITQTYMGVTVQDYENDMTTVLDSGKVTATGWDYNGGVYMVLDGQPTEEDGVITATFRQYRVCEDTWLEGWLPQETLDHMRAYLLTGQDDGFVQEQLVKVVFEVKYDEKSQSSYLFYHSIQTLAEDQAAMANYTSVLLDGQSFVIGQRQSDPYDKAGQSITLQAYLDHINDRTDGNVFYYESFTQCDLDRDGTREVIVSLNHGVGREDPDSYLILHEEDGTVYGYYVTYRGFMDLKTDGTIHSSSGAGDCSISTLWFDGVNFEYEDITYQVGGLTDDPHYYVDQEETTEDRFNAASRSQGLKQEAGWMDFTTENLQLMYGA
jgi:hypothetical protein